MKEPFYPPITKRKKRKDIEYIGYTYKGDEKEEINNDYVTEILDSIKAGKNEEANKITSTESPQKIAIKTDKVINTSPMVSSTQKKIQIIQLPL